jgi:cell division protein ZapA
MPEQNTLNVSILDRDYRVACPTGQEKQLTEAARKLDEKMQEIRGTGKVFGVERIAVMAALNLTHELLKASPQNDNSQIAIERLSAKIDALLPDLDEDAFDLDFGQPEDN